MVEVEGAPPVPATLDSELPTLVLLELPTAAVPPHPAHPVKKSITLAERKHTRIDILPRYRSALGRASLIAALGEGVEVELGGVYRGIRRRRYRRSRFLNISLNPKYAVASFTFETTRRSGLMPGSVTYTRVSATRSSSTPSALTEW